MSNVRTPDPNPGWLSDDALEETRSRVPILYVEAVPVRIDSFGEIVEVGLLLRGSSTGEMSRSIVSGRVMHGESVRGALVRNLEKDLGPLAYPRVPTTVAPVTVGEYLPWPGAADLVDLRQHAVSLVFVVPVSGECAPRQDALELTWLSPDEALTPAVLDDMEGGRGVILQRALASAGHTRV